MGDDGSLRVYVLVECGSGDVYQSGLVVFKKCFGGVLVPPLEVGWEFRVRVSFFGVVGRLVPG